MSTYYIIDLLTFLFPVLLSFDKKVKYFKQWKFVFPSIFITYLVMIVWDHFFTIWGVWSFNKEHVSSFELWEMPIEEHLFFWAIPFACVFIYECVKTYIKKDYIGKYSIGLSITLLIILVIIYYFNYNKLYTGISCACACFLLVQHIFVFRSHWRYMGKFYLSYIITLIPFFIVNGILTSLPVVMYNDQENLGIRMGSIPVEDLIYHLFNFLSVVTIYENLKKKFEKTAEIQLDADLQVDEKP